MTRHEISQPYEPHEFTRGDFGMFCDVCGRLRVADVHLPADHPDAVELDPWGQTGPMSGDLREQINATAHAWLTDPGEHDSVADALLAGPLAEMFVVDFDPGLFGPFTSREEADDWASTYTHGNGSWTVCPLGQPDQPPS